MRQRCFRLSEHVGCWLGPEVVNVFLISTLAQVDLARRVTPLRRTGALTICTEISVKNFRQMVLLFFLYRKQERG